MIIDESDIIIGSQTMFVSSIYSSISWNLVSNLDQKEKMIDYR